MKIYSISLLKKEASGSTQLCIEQDVSSFSFFQRGTVGQFLTFFSKTLSERTATGTRQTVQEQEYMCHAFSSANGLSGICIADAEYPARVAFGLLSKITDEFAQEYPATKWTGADGATPYPALKTLLAKYQNPQEADALSRIHKELDETKVILHKNMEDLLDRGEKLDDLVSKSEGLSSSAKMFYKQAKKTNSCCVVM